MIRFDLVFSKTNSHLQELHVSWKSVSFKRWWGNKTIKESLPVSFAGWVVGNHDTVNCNLRSSGNTDGSSVLPVFSYSFISVVFIVGSIIKCHDIFGIKAKLFSGDVSPFLGENIFAFVSGSKGRLPVFPCQLSVLVHVALGGISLTHILHPWDELGDLETVNVIWENERSDSHVD